MHEILGQSQKSFAAHYAYPLTIGAAVRRHQEQIFSDTQVGFKGHFRNNPIRDDFDATYDKLIQDRRSIDTSLRAVVAASRQVLTREGRGGLIEEVKLALDALEGVDSFSQFERADYASFVMARALAPFGSSPAGSAELMGIVDLSTGGSAPLLSSTYQVIIGAYSKFNWEGATTVRQSLNASRAPHFDVLIEATANEVALHWVRSTGDPYFVKAAVQKVGGIIQSTPAVVPAAGLDLYIRRQFQNLGFSQIPSQRAEMLPAGILAGGEIPNAPLGSNIDVPRFSQGSATQRGDQQAAILIEPSASNPTRLAADGQMQRVAQGVGVAVALVIAFGAVQNW